MPSPSSPLSLEAELVRIVRDYAAPLGVGLVARTCARVQRQFVAVPDEGATVDGRR
jgi:hypothetical protein